jgi:PAS domain S-box-containing protein
MDNYFNPLPIDREIKVNPSAVLMSKINKDGIIEYINHSFSEISGYEEFELIGESMDVLRHPDMPKVIINMLQENFEKNKSTRLINKVLAKDGRYFWLISDFESKTNENNVVALYGHCFAAPSFAIHKVESLYKILSNIEMKSHNTDSSKRYLVGFLEERNMSYNQFMEDLSITRPEFEENFPTKEFIAARPQPIERIVPAASIQTNSNSNKNIQPNQSPIEKPKKNKSILKQVFGK